MISKTLKIFSLILLAAICGFTLIRMNQINFIQDDAYITLRYVDNFLNGNGLVFNNGEKVEGYTNFLWVLLLSFAGLTGKLFSFNVDMSLITQLFSQLSAIAILLLSYFFTKKFYTTKFLLDKDSEKSISHLISLTPPLIISYSTPFLYWGISGMESALFTFLTCLSVYRYLFKSNQPDIVFVVSSVLNSLLRPEGVLIFLLIVSHSFLTNYLPVFKIKDELRNPDAIILRKEIIFYLVPVLLYIAFRYFYYGYFLPNTFYAKTGFNLEHFNRGIEYVLTGIKNNFLYGLLFLIPIINFREKTLRKETYFFYYFVIIYLMFIILIGGDVLPIDRFFLPILPLVIIFSTITIYHLTFLKISSIKKYLVIASVAIIYTCAVISSYLNNYPEMKLKRSYEVGLVTKMKVYADWINRIGSEDKSGEIKTVALSTIGSFSYYSGAEVIDIVGLTDKYIAHNPVEVPGIDEELPVLWKERRYNADYVLQRNPDYIIFPAGAKPTAFAECAIFVQYMFYKNYYCQLVYSEELKQLLPIYTKRNQTLITENSQCDVKFLKPFIEANNLFLSLNYNKKPDLIKNILDKCDEAELKCPLRLSDIEAVRGSSFYHTGDLINAKSSFENSIKLDSLNMISRFYLMKIYNEEGDESAMITQYQFLKRFSPYALPAHYIGN